MHLDSKDIHVEKKSPWSNQGSLPFFEGVFSRTPLPCLKKKYAHQSMRSIRQPQLGIVRSKASLALAQPTRTSSSKKARRSKKATGGSFPRKAPFPEPNQTRLSKQAKKKRERREREAILSPCLPPPFLVPPFPDREAACIHCLIFTSFVSSPLFSLSLSLSLASISVTQHRTTNPKQPSTSTEQKQARATKSQPLPLLCLCFVFCPPLEAQRGGKHNSEPGYM